MSSLSLPVELGGGCSSLSNWSFSLLTALIFLSSSSISSSIFFSSSTVNWWSPCTFSKQEMKYYCSHQRTLWNPGTSDHWENNHHFNVLFLAQVTDIFCSLKQERLAWLVLHNFNYASWNQNKWKGIDKTQSYCCLTLSSGKRTWGGIFKIFFFT